MTKGRSKRVVPCFAAALAVAGWASVSRADEAQVAEGAKLFAKNCAKCHGNAGQGTKKAPAVVGKDALPLDPPATAKVRKTQFHTAQDVAAVRRRRRCRRNKPGSLTADEYYAILAFDLKANGVDVSNKKIDPHDGRRDQAALIMFHVVRLATIHPVLAHFTIGGLPLIVIAYAMAVWRRSPAWTFVGDVGARRHGGADARHRPLRAGLERGGAVAGRHREVALAPSRLRRRRRRLRWRSSPRCASSCGAATEPVGRALLAAVLGRRRPSRGITGWIGGEVLVFHSGHGGARRRRWRAGAAGERHGCGAARLPRCHAPGARGVGRDQHAPGLDARAAPARRGLRGASRSMRAACRRSAKVMADEGAKDAKQREPAGLDVADAGRRRRRHRRGGAARRACRTSRRPSEKRAATAPTATSRCAGNSREIAANWISLAGRSARACCRASCDRSRASAPRGSCCHRPHRARAGCSAARPRPSTPTRSDRRWRRSRATRL